MGPMRILLEPHNTIFGKSISTEECARETFLNQQRGFSETLKHQLTGKDPFAADFEGGPNFSLTASGFLPQRRENPLAVREASPPEPAPLSSTVLRSASAPSLPRSGSESGTAGSALRSLEGVGSSRGGVGNSPAIGERSKGGVALQPLPPPLPTPAKARTQEGAVWKDVRPRRGRPLKGAAYSALSPASREAMQLTLRRLRGLG